jgi:hypothetical protein
MDKPLLYIETSIVSYLAARPSRDPVTLRNQQLTHEWWDTRREEYELFTSAEVLHESALGDPEMAKRRLALLSRLGILLPSDLITGIGEALLKGVPLPSQAKTDALHIAFAAVYGMAYLLTWNCKHIANPRLQGRIGRIVYRLGYPLPVLCTPEELLEE